MIKSFYTIIFLIVCTLLTIIAFDFFYGLNSGLSSNPKCFILNINDLPEMSLETVFYSYVLYFIFGLFAFGYSYFLFTILINKVEVIKNFFKEEKPTRDLTTLENIIFAVVYLPLPIFIYDLLLC